MKILELLRDSEINKRVIFALTVLLFTSFYIFDINGTLILIATTIAMFVVYKIAHPEHSKIWKDPFFIFISIFTAYCMLTSLWAWDPTRALQMGMSCLKKLVTFSVLYMCYIKDKDIKGLITALVWTTGIVAFISIWDEGLFTLIRYILIQQRSAIKFTNINALGLLMATGIIIILFQLLFEKKRTWTNLFIFIIALLVLLETGSRKAMIVVFIGCLLVIFAKTITHDRKSTLRNWFIISIIFIGLMLLLFTLPIFDMFTERMVEAFHLITGQGGKIDGGDVLRAKMIFAGVEQFKQTPILGIGFDNTYLLAPEGLKWAYLHNNFIEILACGGLVGFGIFYSMYIYFFGWFFKDIMSRNHDTLICLILVICNVITQFASVSYEAMITYVYLTIYFIQIQKIKERIHYTKEDGMIYKLFKFATDKDFRFRVLARKGKYNDMPDEEYLKREFKAMMGYELDLENPKTFNEKLQWLKLYNRKPEYTMMVDKYKVRDYIAKVLGEEYLIPLIGVYDNPDQIDFDKLPNKFVLKCNHNSGLGMCICTDKSKLDIEKVKAGLRAGLNENYYLSGREWPYKDVERKIICEQFMEDASGSGDLTDYKFFCFDGKVDCVMVTIERNTGNPKFYFFDQAWNLLRYNKRGKAAPADFTLPKPDCMDDMFEIAAKLSKGLIYARIDLYACNNKIYFGEITFFPDSGFDYNILPETDLRFGELTNLNIQKDTK